MISQLLFVFDVLKLERRHSGVLENCFIYYSLASSVDQRDMKWPFIPLVNI